jgi:hypothetical protein
VLDRGLNVMNLKNGTAHTFPDRRLDQLLHEHGSEAYVDALVKQFGSMVAWSEDQRAFRYIRLAYAGAKNVRVDRLFVREISKLLTPKLQAQLIKELPRSYRREVEAWKSMPAWARFILRLRA